jgi:hypothetical protein
MDIAPGPLVLRVIAGPNPSVSRLALSPLPLAGTLVSGVEGSRSTTVSSTSSCTVASSAVAPGRDPELPSAPFDCPEVVLFRPVDPDITVLEPPRRFVFPATLGLYALITNSGIFGVDETVVDALSPEAPSVLFDVGSIPMNKHLVSALNKKDWNSHVARSSITYHFCRIDR